MIPLTVGGHKSGSPSRIAPQSRDQILNQEAVERAKEFWDPRIIKCNGNYYFRSSTPGLGSTFVFECRRLTKFSVNGTTHYPRQLSEADQLNGVDPLPIEWEGGIKIEFETCRQSESGNGRVPGWGQWYDKKSIDNQWIKKVKGTWQIAASAHIGNDNDRALPFDCSSIESYLTGGTSTSGRPAGSVPDAEVPSNIVQVQGTKAKVRGVVFAEFSGQKGDDKRNRGTRFARSEARYIRWDLFAVFESKFDEVVENDLKAVWFKVNADGSLKQRSEQQGGQSGMLQDPNHPWIYFFNNTGWNKPGNWETGHWKVKIYQHDVLVATGEFEIY